MDSLCVYTRGSLELAKVVINEAMALIQYSMPILFLVLSLYHHIKVVVSCNQLERHSLLSFISSPPLNWSQSTNCCQWQGVSCRRHHGAARVTRLWLPETHLSGTINPSFLQNLPFLAHINLSRNHFSGPFAFQHLHSSIKTLDLSSNGFNASINPSFLHHAFNLTTFNVSNNTFTGSIPSSICKTSPRLKMLDFSMNQFSGPITPGLGDCQNLRVFKAGSNNLSGSLPYDLYTIPILKKLSLPKNQFSGPINSSIATMLSNLTILELNDNYLIGELPSNIGLLSKIKRILLHANSFKGSIPPSLMNCSSLTTLILRDNNFGGEISTLNFSKLHRLEAIDLGNNRFFGNIPESLCSCTSLVALRLAFNLINLLGCIFIFLLINNVFRNVIHSCFRHMLTRLGLSCFRMFTSIS